MGVLSERGAVWQKEPVSRGSLTNWALRLKQPSPRALTGFFEHHAGFRGGVEGRIRWLF